MAINQEILDKITNNKYIDGSELAKLFMDLVNSMGSRSEDFSEVVTREHRYLQQEAFNMFLSCIQKWQRAYLDDRFDPRNEYACKASKVMFDALRDNGLY